jgi:hypothetical protein
MKYKIFGCQTEFFFHFILLWNLPDVLSRALFSFIYIILRQSILWGHEIFLREFHFFSLNFIFNQFFFRSLVRGYVFRLLECLQTKCNGLF